VLVGVSSSSREGYRLYVDDFSGTPRLTEPPRDLHRDSQALLRYSRLLRLDSVRLHEAGVELKADAYRERRALDEEPE
jgi:hypothetical protein